MTTYRKAELADVPQIFALINRYVAKRVMLPRALDDLTRSVQEFTVAAERGRVVGCGSLKFYDRRLAEIRSLSVEPGRQSHGIGKGLVKRLLREARELGLEVLFALTTVPEFFRNCGFHEVAREKFPAKIQRDCLSCELYPTCAEKTVVIGIRRRKPLAYARPLAEDLPSLSRA